MDPITIVGLIGSVVSIGDVVAKSIRKLSELRSRYHNAPFQITTLVGQLYIIQAAVGQLMQWKSSAFLNESRYLELASQIEASLDSFCPLILALEQYLDKFDAVSDSDSLHMQDRLEFMWNEKDIDVYLNMVDRQVNALNLFLQAIQWQVSPTLLDFKARDCTSSIVGLGDNGTSIFSDNTNALSVQFDFDAVVVASRVYQNAHRSHLKRAIRANRPDGSFSKEKTPLQTRDQVVLGPIKEESGESTHSEPSYSRVPLRSRLSHAVRSGGGFHPGSWLDATPWRSRRKSIPQQHDPPVGQKRDDKILILGPSQSGKTTVFKLIQYFIDGEPTEEERAAWAETILTYVAKGTLEYPDTNNLDIETLSNASQSDFQDVAAAISLWEDSDLLERYHWSFPTQPANIRQLALKMQRLARQGQHHYTPTTQDILQVFVKTTGIHETTMYYNSRSFRICDVGGTRAERKKWIHAFPDASAIIFTADATSYSKVLSEDEDTLGVTEELSLFEHIANDRRFADTRLLLVLTRIDQLDNVLVRNPVTPFPNFTSSNLPNSPGYKEDYLFELEMHFLNRLPDWREPSEFPIVRSDLIHDGLYMVENILKTLLEDTTS
ncbi:unnamed protein product [Clonostachys rosea]|uniref:G-protein alpha subunit-domain-containing protein n=1 Tax=Bionectria ochroleuca TaxID=29856 RepID=A0ABY6V383_BIOOC|nr:unnamed protein product [Clonostachys rosea]